MGHDAASTPLEAYFEVCTVAGLNVTGIRIQRLSGDVWRHQQVSHQGYIQRDLPSSPTVDHVHPLQAEYMSGYSQVSMQFISAQKTLRGLASCFSREGLYASKHNW